MVGEELARRFGLPKWRYTNSGSESTMDAIRIARAFTGRDVVMKIFGSYHGHHDAVMVSIGVGYDRIDDHDHPAQLAYGGGIPQATVDMTVRVPFNDAGCDGAAHRSSSTREGRKPACVIMEAAMMNLGVILPEPGYLEAVRDITRRHGVVLVFDEVKTGLTIAAGGAMERYGVDVRPGDPRQGARGWPAVGGDRRRPRRSWASSRTAPSTRWAPTTGTRSGWRPPARTFSRC